MTTLPTNRAPISLEPAPSNYAHVNRVQKRKLLEKYRLCETIGQGEFAKVKLAYQRGSHEKVAVKLVRKDSLSSDLKRAKLFREFSILRQVRHPNIIQLREVLETEKAYAMVMEFATGGELFEYIQAHKRLSEAEARRLFVQLISAVEHMHGQGIVHRDLKLVS